MSGTNKRQQKEAAGGRNDEQQQASAIDPATTGADFINPAGGGIAEPAADIKPGEGEQPADMKADAAHMANLGGDVGTVKGPGLGSVQGGVDPQGGTDAPNMAEQGASKPAA